MPADAKLVREVFLAAAELPVAERATYLTAHCGDDAELQAAVQRLVAAHDEPASVLVRPAPGMPTAVYVPITEKPGTKIGPYKLMEQIGESACRRQSPPTPAETRSEPGDCRTPALSARCL